MAMESSTSDTFSNENAGNASTATPTSGFSDKVADAGSSVREKAGSFKNTIADALESGAEKLRQQRASSQTALTTAEAGAADTIAEENRLAQTSNQIAGGMQGAADWLREADLDGLKSGIERQVKDHPGRSLAIAVGVGYLLGKAFRK
jgi:ElaB/YqjD/DUF883 family membrane-anchored ribosome-binding protein